MELFKKRQTNLHCVDSSHLWQQFKACCLSFKKVMVLLWVFPRHQKKKNRVDSIFFKADQDPVLSTVTFTEQKITQEFRVSLILIEVLWHLFYNAVKRLREKWLNLLR